VNEPETFFRHNEEKIERKKCFQWKKHFK